VRLAIARRLFVRKASAAEVAGELGLPVDRVRRRIRRMAEEGLVERVGGRPRRGVLENVYTIKARSELIDPAAEREPRLRDELVETLLRSTFSEAIRSLRGGVFTARADYAVLQASFRVDRQGWEECRGILADARRRMAEAAETSARRLAETGEDPIHAGSASLWFELAPRSRRRSGRRD